MKAPQPKPTLNIKVSKFRPPHPKWQTIQQVLRTIAQIVGGALLGESVAEGDMFQAAVGGGINIIAFAWWWYWELTRPDDAPPELEEGTTTPTPTPTPKEKPK